MKTTIKFRLQVTAFTIVAALVSMLISRAIILDLFHWPEFWSFVIGLVLYQCTLFVFFHPKTTKHYIVRVMDAFDVHILGHRFYFVCQFIGVTLESWWPDESSGSTR